MFPLQSASFRQLLLVAFLMIAAVLAAASLRGLFTLERLMERAREGSEQAVHRAAQAQTLADRAVTMERAARQYLVLDDAALRQRFNQAADDASEVLQQLVTTGLPDELGAQWLGHLEVIREQVRGPRETARQREQALSLAFRDLAEVNAGIAERVRRSNERQNAQLQAELEASRIELARQVVWAIGLAVGLALVFGLWLARPMKRLERAIVGLGENRLDEPIEIRGPADVRMVGRRLDWLRLRLAELDSDKARFLRHVSHELKTPLASLREGVALLQDGVAGELTAKQGEIARILQHNTGILQSQIEDLLRFNAAAFEARRLSRRPVDLLELLRSLVDAQKLQWHAKALNVEVQGVPVRAEVDEDKLGTALGNLLTNAIRFSPHGGTLRLSLSLQGERVRIDVSDEGPGVAPGDAGRVFEPFYRGERQPLGLPRGTGVGLSIVQEYVAAHGGRVTLLPQAPGATFRIELPHA